MSELRKILEETINSKLIQAVLSNSRDKEQAFKVKVRPVELKGKLFFQETLYRGAQVFHGNYTEGETVLRLEKYLEELFGQGEIKCRDKEATVLISRKGKVTVKCRKVSKTDMPAAKKNPEKSSPSRDENTGIPEHNRRKQYILPEGEPIDFLVHLGVQTPQGKVVQSRYDKFRQINRYLEFVRDVLEELPKDRPLRIIDFGCGKSYLTFALYYYLWKLQGRDVRVTGLDLKKDVIAHCNQLAVQLGYEHLQFEQGDIASYGGAEEVDMVVTLHACDTATDYALEKAVAWGAKVIFAVPCCQHEINKQIKNATLQPILKYGLLKERLSALVTDGLRANLLEQQGYDTQILEFIDMEHTPKNLLIRGVKRAGMRPVGKSTKIDEITEFLQISPTLERLLKE